MATRSAAEMMKPGGSDAGGAFAFQTNTPLTRYNIGGSDPWTQIGAFINDLER
jgi:hypothetical protein